MVGVNKQGTTATGHTWMVISLSVVLSDLRSAAGTLLA